MLPPHELPRKVGVLIKPGKDMEFVSVYVKPTVFTLIASLKMFSPILVRMLGGAFAFNESK